MQTECLKVLCLKAMYLRVIFGPLLAVVLLSACETTGDPSQGGLFGWSQQKADARVENLQTEAEYYTKEADRTERRSRELDRELTQEKQKLLDQHQTLDQLLAENRKLHEKWLNLQSQHQAAETKKSTLESERLTLLRDIQSLGDRVIDSDRNSQSMTHRLEQLNEQYKEAILLLLQ